MFYGQIDNINKNAYKKCAWGTHLLNCDLEATQRNKNVPTSFEKENKNYIWHRILKMYIASLWFVQGKETNR